MRREYRYRIIGLLVGTNGFGFNELLELTGIPRASLARWLKRLESEGLIGRSGDGRWVVKLDKVPSKLLLAQILTQFEALNLAPEDREELKAILGSEGMVEAILAMHNAVARTITGKTFTRVVNQCLESSLPLFLSEVARGLINAYAKAYTVNPLALPSIITTILQYKLERTIELIGYAVRQSKQQLGQHYQAVVEAVKTMEKYTPPLVLNRVPKQSKKHLDRLAVIVGKYPAKSMFKLTAPNTGVFNIPIPNLATITNYVEAPQPTQQKTIKQLQEIGEALLRSGERPLTDTEIQRIITQ